MFGVNGQPDFLVMQRADVLRSDRHQKLARALESGIDASLAEKRLHRIEIFPPEPGQPSRLFQAEVRDRKLVRVVDRLADDAGIAAASSVAHQLLLENHDLSARLELLQEEGADVTYHDAFVPELPEQGLSSTELDPSGSDCVVIVTKHTGIDYNDLVERAPLVVDLRNATGDNGTSNGKVWKL